VHFATESVEEYFLKRLYENLPTHADKIVKKIRDEKGGSLLHSSMATRNNGRSERWKVVKDVFELHMRKLGYEKYERVEVVSEPKDPLQQSLF
jgi:hypothetical protein